MDEETHQRFRLNAVKRTSGRHIFNIIGLRRNLQSAVFARNFAPLQIGRNLLPLHGSIIIDGTLGEPVFSGDKAGEVYGKMLGNLDNDMCLILHPSHDLASIALY